MSNGKTAAKLTDDQKRQLGALRDKLKTYEEKRKNLNKMPDSPEKVDAIDRTKRHIAELENEVKILEKHDSA